VLRRSKSAQRVITVVVVPLLLVIAVGASFAFAKPEHASAAPFKGIVITMTEAASRAIHLIEEVRGVAAVYERKIVSTALQSMRLDQGLKVVPAVTMPTNDMACFPSLEHCLLTKSINFSKGCKKRSKLTVNYLSKPAFYST